MTRHCYLMLALDEGGFVCYFYDEHSQLKSHKRFEGTGVDVVSDIAWYQREWIINGKLPVQ